MEVKEVLVWTPELEVSLFHSMKVHKPIGLNRHFHMACIHDKFATSTGKRNISSDQLWQHLKQLYNLPALNEAETVPFPNEENEFNLPDEIFEPPGQGGSDYNDDEPSGSSSGLKLKLQSVPAPGSRPTTPEMSPKRKRTRERGYTSQPPSPHTTTPTSTKRRR